jgi:hypothetical protein
MKKAMVFMAFSTAVILTALSCQTKHQVETVHKIEVAPMHITIDVNVKVDKALDDFFSDLDQVEDQIEPEAK